MNKHRIPRSAVRAGNPELDRAIAERLLIETPMAFRAESIAKSDDRTVDVIFSEGAEYRQWWGREKLDVGGCNMERLKQGVSPLLWNHDKDVVIGVVQNARRQNGAAVATVRFSNSAQGEEKYQDVLDGILCGISCGYTIDVYERDDANPNDPLYTIKKWTPFEISLVAYAADPKAMVKREGYLQPIIQIPEDTGDGDSPVPTDENRE